MQTPPLGRKWTTGLPAKARLQNPKKKWSSEARTCITQYSRYVLISGYQVICPGVHRIFYEPAQRHAALLIAMDWFEKLVLNANKTKKLTSSNTGNWLVIWLYRRADDLRRCVSWILLWLGVFSDLFKERSESELYFLGDYVLLCQFFFSCKIEDFFRA